MDSLSLDSEIFTRAAEDIVTRGELAERLRSGKKLRIKLGIDATAEDLHIGHAVPLWKIRAMQEQGHKAVIILGEFTTKIGDPTGKMASRPVLAPEVIRKNVAKLKKRVEQILLTDPEVYEVHKNSEWFGKMKTEEFLRLLSLITHARLIERDMFQKRIREGKEISMAEILYPVLQGYDSVMIRSDLTIIGSDQLFNEHMGRFFQERFGQTPQSIMTIKLLPGLDGGEKMSKSLGNYIGLGDSPKDKFGKAMRVLDPLIIPYLEAYTDVSLEDMQKEQEALQRGKNPRDVKLLFAEALVRRYHGEKIAARERERFLSVFSKGEMPSDIPQADLSQSEWNPVDLLTAIGFASSRSDARRLIREGAMEVAGRVVASDRDTIRVENGDIVRVGKRRFVRIGIPSR